MLEQRFELAIVRDDEIGARLEESSAFPKIDAASCLFVGRHSDCQSTDLFDFFNFDEAVTEAEDLRAGNTGVTNDSFDDHGFGELFVVIERAVNVFAKELTQPQYGNLVANVFQIRA